jgi:hypothetical protein
MNPTGSFACFKGRDNGVGRAIDHADITRSFIADKDEVTLRFGAHHKCAGEENTKNKPPIHT